MTKYRIISLLLALFVLICSLSSCTNSFVQDETKETTTTNENQSQQLEETASKENQTQKLEETISETTISYEDPTPIEMNID